MAEDSAKKSARQKENPPNPTGAGGFQDHPENIKAGVWIREKSYKYNLRVYMQKSLEELRATLEDMETNPKAYTAGQKLALADVMRALNEIDREALDLQAADHVVKKLYGNAPFITEEEEGVTDTPHIEITFK